MFYFSGVREAFLGGDFPLHVPAISRTPQPEQVEDEKGRWWTGSTRWRICRERVRMACRLRGKPMVVSADASADSMAAVPATL